MYTSPCHSSRLTSALVTDRPTHSPCPKLCHTLCVVSLCVVSLCVVSLCVVSLCVVSLCVVSLCVRVWCVWCVCVVSLCVVCVLCLCVLCLCVLCVVCVLCLCVLCLSVLCVVSLCVLCLCVCVVSVCVWLCGLVVLVVVVCCGGGGGGCSCRSSCCCCCCRERFSDSVSVQFLFLSLRLLTITVMRMGSQGRVEMAHPPQAPTLSKIRKQMAIIAPQSLFFGAFAYNGVNFLFRPEANLAAAYAAALGVCFMFSLSLVVWESSIATRSVTLVTDAQQELFGRGLAQLMPGWWNQYKHSVLLFLMALALMGPVKLWLWDDTTTTICEEMLVGEHTALFPECQQMTTSFAGTQQTLSFKYGWVLFTGGVAAIVLCYSCMVGEETCILAGAIATQKLFALSGYVRRPFRGVGWSWERGREVGVGECGEKVVG